MRCVLRSSLRRLFVRRPFVRRSFVRRPFVRHSLLACWFLAATVAACGEDSSTATVDALAGDDALADAAADDADALAADVTPATDDTAAADSSGQDSAGIDVAADSAQSMTCTQVGQCIETACQGGSQPCGLACAAGANPLVAAQIDALSACVASKCQNGLCKGNVTSTCMNACSGSQCGSVLFDCFEDHQPGGNACKTAMDCFAACDAAGGANHFTCLSKCYTGLTLLGKTQLHAFTDCLAKTNGGADGMSQCQGQYTACVTGGASGTGTCAEIADCTAHCPITSSSCPSECLVMGSKAAQQAATDLQACFIANQADQSKCFGKLQACAAPAGTGKCNAIQKCTESCKAQFTGGDDSGSCTIGCLHQAAPASADAFLTLFTCVIPNCPVCLQGGAGCQSCLDQKCSAQLSACLAN